MLKVKISLVVLITARTVWRPTLPCYGKTPYQHFKKRPFDTMQIGGRGHIDPYIELGHRIHIFQGIGTWQNTVSTKMSYHYHGRSTCWLVSCFAIVFCIVICHWPLHLALDL